MYMNDPMGMQQFGMSQLSAYHHQQVVAMGLMNQQQFGNYHQPPSNTDDHLLVLLTEV